MKKISVYFGCVLGLIGLPGALTGQTVNVVSHGVANTVVVNGVLVSGASNPVLGTGPALAEVRTVPAFNGIRLDTACELVYEVGGPQALSVSAQKNILPLVLTRVEGGILVIESKGAIQSTEPLRLNLTGPSLETLRLAGAGRISMTGVQGPALHATLSGSGDMAVSGQVDSLVLDLTGSGRIQAASLKADSVTATLSGSGNIEAWARQEARVRLTGSGNIQIVGNPTARSVDKTGSGRVSFVDADSR